jgi:hypothetical protein
MNISHFPDATCDGRVCQLCKGEATHRYSEQVSHHDYRRFGPRRVVFLCCDCTGKLFDGAPCKTSLDSPARSLEDFEVVEVEGDLNFGEWIFKNSGRELVHKFFPYEISIDKCRTGEEILDWFGHMLEKTWVTSDTIGDLVVALDEIVGLQIVDKLKLADGFKIHINKFRRRTDG